MSSENRIKSFIHDGRFPVYRYDQLKTVQTNNNSITIEKIPMFVDGVVVWTHFKITLDPKWKTDPYQTDIDIRLTMLEGESWLLILYKGQHAGDVLDAGDIVIIPNEAEYTVLNRSINEKCVYTLDANTLLEMDK